MRVATLYVVHGNLRTLMGPPRRGTHRRSALGLVLERGDPPLRRAHADDRSARRQIPQPDRPQAAGLALARTLGHLPLRGRPGPPGAGRRLACMRSQGGTLTTRHDREKRVTSWDSATHARLRVAAPRAGDSRRRPIEALIATRRLGETANDRAGGGPRASERSWSWTDVGRALGVIKQATHEKLRARVQGKIDKRLSKLDRAEEAGHARIARRAQHGREKLAQLPRPPGRPNRHLRRLDECERRQPEKLARDRQKARKELARAERTSRTSSTRRTPRDPCRVLPDTTTAADWRAQRRIPANRRFLAVSKTVTGVFLGRGYEFLPLRRPSGSAEGHTPPS
jgi:hypothetical protein